MRIAHRVYSLAQEQNEPALMIGAYRALAGTLYFLGDFETARQYAMRGVEIWRSGGVPFSVEEIHAPAVSCLAYLAVCEWHLGEIVYYKATITEALSLASALKDTHALAMALFHAGCLSHFERHPPEVERYASHLVELSTQQSFAFWLPQGAILRGWACSASGTITKGLAYIEEGLRDYRATGSRLGLPYFIAIKAEALHLANRTSEALEVIREAETLGERSEERWWHVHYDIPHMFDDSPTPMFAKNGLRRKLSGAHGRTKTKR
jgi:predicted ATPase